MRPKALLLGGDQEIMAAAHPSIHEEEEALRASSTKCAEESREPNGYGSNPKPHNLPSAPPVPPPTCE